MVLSKISTRMRYLILAFFVFNILVKVFNIQANPSAVTYDEVIYLAEAQSIVKYGTDLMGDWRPWHLEPSDSYYTELTSTMLVPGFVVFPNYPVLAGKFVPLILGSLIPVLLGLIAYRLRRRKNVFVLTALIATLNPWIFQFSRMGYDSLFSISFYLIGIVTVLYFKGWKKIWAVAPLFLGFFQYQGHKPLLVPLIGLVLLYLIIEKYPIKKIISNLKKLLRDKDLLATVVVLLFSVVLTVAYLYRLPNLTSGERASEFSVVDGAELSSVVNDSRRMSFDTPLNKVYTNKYTVLVRVLTERFLNSFNPEKLFIRGNAAVDTFTVLDYGFFHLIDILAIIVALIFMFAKKKDYRIAIFLLIFTLIGTLPNVIRTGEPWITLRGAFTFLGLVLIMGVGLGAFLDLVNNKTRLLIVGLYLLATTPFFFIYFYRYPITHTNNIGFYERVVASYVDRIGLDEEVFIAPDRDDATFVYQIHYNQMLNQENREQVSNSIKNRQYQIDKLMIEGGCSNAIKESENKTALIYLTKEPCEFVRDPEKTTQIKSLIDTGTIFTVYNDRLCSQYQLGAYPSIKRNLMAVEKLSDQEFCESFFSRN